MLPGDALPLTDGQEIRARLEHQIDAVLDGGDCGHRADDRHRSGGEPAAGRALRQGAIAAISGVQRP